MCHHAVGPHYGPVAYGDSRHHADIVAKPHIVAYHHRAFAVKRALGERQAHVLASTLSVAVVGDEHIGARQQIVANGDAVDGRDMGVIAYGAAAANDDGGFETDAVVRIPRRQLHSWRDVCTVAHGDIFQPSQIHGPPTQMCSSAPVGEAMTKENCINVISDESENVCHRITVLMISVFNVLSDKIVQLLTLVLG